MIRTPNAVCMTVVITACALIYAGEPPSANAEELCYPSSDVQLTASSLGETMLVINEDIRDWVKFDSLSRQWKDASKILSSITEIAVLPSYQKIIGMGEAAIPLILAQMRSEGADPDHWFWALRAITDVNPVPSDARGDMEKMAKAWLLWGEKEGYARQLASA